MAKNPNQNVWSYVPPHRGAVLDGGSPQSIANDSSVSGGWSDRSELGSSTSGFMYVEEAAYDGKSYVRRDGKWIDLFKGDGFSDYVTSLEELQEKVRKIDERLMVLENSFAVQDGWDERRVSEIETLVKDLIAGNITFEKITSKAAITAWVTVEDEGDE